jgi:hypothetical protein
MISTTIYLKIACHIFCTSLLIAEIMLFILLLLFFANFLREAYLTTKSLIE